MAAEAAAAAAAAAAAQPRWDIRSSPKAENHWGEGHGTARAAWQASPGILRPKTAQRREQHRLAGTCVLLAGTNKTNTISRLNSPHNLRLEQEIYVD